MDEPKMGTGLVQAPDVPVTCRSLPGWKTETRPKRTQEPGRLYSMKRQKLIGSGTRGTGSGNAPTVDLDATVHRVERRQDQCHG